MEAKTISPITQAKDVTLPTREDLLRAMKIAENSPEVAQYLCQRVREIAEKSRLLNKTPEAREATQQILKAVEEFAQLVAYKYPADSQVWSGKEPTSSTINMQEGIAKQAATSLAQKNYPGIRFDFAISETGHFVRGYASTEKGASQLDEGTIETLDNLFNAWLADQHNIVTENGDFYYMDAMGHKKDKLTREEVEKLFSDSAREYKDYLKGKGVDTELVSRQRDYPGEHRLEESRKKAIDKIIKAEQEAEEKVEEKVETEVQPTTMGRS
ncbi:hypothetical protein OQJ13_10800 [Legionella sp. PATHC035]|uniref:hypothetical protein n=1 Tax=Legionella sp. PATHC035 TaxID=2992040 RepID=UPI002242D561|nr:hypothetical protein [Legionella sp. PATHC035]MCW8409464.1 hypothetical protein [Legionella sp. PATHC035]